MDLREAAQQALNVMEDTQWAVADQAPNEDVAAHDKAMNTLRAALAKPKQEPVAWLIEVYDIYAKRTVQRLVFDNPKNMHGVKITAYYTAPPMSEPLSFAGVKITEVRLPENMAMRFDGDVLVIERAHGIGGEE